MSYFSLLLISFSLAMDAFAVSISAGITFRKVLFRQAFLLACTFWVFQAIMPFLWWLGWYLVHDLIELWSSWIAFFLLAWIGWNMIREAHSENEDERQDYLSLKSLFLLGIATSIDALAVGIGFALLPIHIGIAVLMIGIITFFLCFIWVYIGARFWHVFEKKAEILGGVLLIGLGVKILVEYLFF